MEAEIDLIFSTDPMTLLSASSCSNSRCGIEFWLGESGAGGKTPSRGGLLQLEGGGGGGGDN